MVAPFVAMTPETFFVGTTLDFDAFEFHCANESPQPSKRFSRLLCTWLKDPNFPVRLENYDLRLLRRDIQETPATTTSGGDA
jgi:hypothetical protein